MIDSEEKSATAFGILSGLTSFNTPTSVSSAAIAAFAFKNSLELEKCSEPGNGVKFLMIGPEVTSCESQ